MKVITLRDYAKQSNISYEAVRKQVVRYQEELAGHLIRDGRQQFLDEEAVAFLDARRQKNPVAIIQIEKDEKIQELEGQVKQLLIKTAEQADRISEMAQWKADNAMLLAGAEQTRMALEAAEGEKKILEGYIQDAKAEIALLSEEKKEARNKARLAEEASQKAQDELQRANERERALREYAAACQAYNALSGLRRAFTKPPVMPELKEE